MSYLPSEEGQGLVEYSLILTLVSLAVMAALVLLGPAVSDMFSSVVTALVSV
jgi:pilus assembly protein Flp/PilA